MFGHTPSKKPNQTKPNQTKQGSNENESEEKNERMHPPF
jgi:hypothetical protein